MGIERRGRGVRPATTGRECTLAGSGVRECLRRQPALPARAEYFLALVGNAIGRAPVQTSASAAERSGQKRGTVAGTPLGRPERRTSGCDIDGAAEGSASCEGVRG